MRDLPVYPIDDLGTGLCIVDFEINDVSYGVVSIEENGGVYTGRVLFKTGTNVGIRYNTNTRSFESVDLGSNYLLQLYQKAGLTGFQTAAHIDVDEFPEKTDFAFKIEELDQ